MNKTSISYADFTWNPFLGCSRISAGCGDSNGGGCYAERLAATRLAHLPAYDGLTTNGRWNGKVRLLPERLDEPLRRNKPRVIFLGDMSDLFHPAIPFEFVAEVYDRMELASWHTFLTLTKRPERRLEFLIRRGRSRRNIWEGVTVENQEQADIRIPLLLKTPAAHRWVSAEPLLGPLDLRRWLEDPCNCTVPYEDGAGQHSPNCQTFKQPWGIDEIVTGGESGPKARPCDVEWIRSLRDQARAAGTKFYVKQLGANVIDNAVWGLGKAVCARPGSPMSDPTEWPADLRVRELGWM